jgi:hypothetical protein
MTIPTIPPEILQKLDQLNAWRVERERDYGHFGQQLNLLWDDIDQGLLGAQAKTGKWYQQIKRIKANTPKPDIEALQAELDEYFANLSNTENET